MTRVKLPVALRRHAGGAAQLELPGATVAECLEELERRFPDLSQELRDETGRLLAEVNLYINGEDLRYRLSLDTPLQPGDELTILLPVAGGQSSDEF